MPDDLRTYRSEHRRLRPPTPSQDLLPASGVGNLIAAPLFRPARRNGATVFLDLETLEPHKDQWACLSTLGRMTPHELRRAAIAAPDDIAPGLFEKALAVPGADRFPFDLGRVLLCYGERLRPRAPRRGPQPALTSENGPACPQDPEGATASGHPKAELVAEGAVLGLLCRDRYASLRLAADVDDGPASSVAVARLMAKPVTLMSLLAGRPG